MMNASGFDEERLNELVATENDQSDVKMVCLRSLYGEYKSLQNQHAACQIQLEDSILCLNSFKQLEQKWKTIANKLSANELKNIQENMLLRRRYDAKTLELFERENICMEAQMDLKNIKEKIAELQQSKKEIQDDLFEMQQYFLIVNDELRGKWEIGCKIFTELKLAKAEKKELVKRVEELERHLDEGKAYMPSDLTANDCESGALIQAYHSSSIPNQLESMQMQLDQALLSKERLEHNFLEMQQSAISVYAQLKKKLETDRVLCNKIRNSNTVFSNRVKELQLQLTEESARQSTINYRQETTRPQRGSFISGFIMWLLCVIFIVAAHICYHGALIPAGVHLTLHHDRLPPQ